LTVHSLLQHVQLRTAAPLLLLLLLPMLLLVLWLLLLFEELPQLRSILYRPVCGVQVWCSLPDECCNGFQRLLTCLWSAAKRSRKSKQCKDRKVTQRVQALRGKSLVARAVVTLRVFPRAWKLQ
jgi:hypothetical protein